MFAALLGASVGIAIQVYLRDTYIIYYYIIIIIYSSVSLPMPSLNLQLHIFVTWNVWNLSDSHQSSHALLTVSPREEKQRPWRVWVLAWHEQAGWQIIFGQFVKVPPTCWMTTNPGKLVIYVVKPVYDVFLGKWWQLKMPRWQKADYGVMPISSCQLEWWSTLDFRWPLVKAWKSCLESIQGFSFQQY